jgi:hypothetical protein
MELLLCASIGVAFAKLTSDNALLLELNLLRQRLLTPLLKCSVTLLATVHHRFRFLRSPLGSDRSQQRDAWVRRPCSIATPEKQVIRSLGRFSRHHLHETMLSRTTMLNRGNLVKYCCLALHLRFFRSVHEPQLACRVSSTEVRRSQHTHDVPACSENCQNRVGPLRS